MHGRAISSLPLPTRQWHRLASRKRLCHIAQGDKKNKQTRAIYHSICTMSHHQFVQEFKKMVEDSPGVSAYAPTLSVTSLFGARLFPEGRPQEELRPQGLLSQLINPALGNVGYNFDLHRMHWSGDFVTSLAYSSAAQTSK